MFYESLMNPLPGDHKTWKLLLLLEFTHLKVAVVVMVPRSEVGWCGENAEDQAMETAQQSQSTVLHEPLRGSSSVPALCCDLGICGDVCLF